MYDYKIVEQVSRKKKSMGGAPLETVKQYIENQKTSQRQKDKMG